MKTVYKSAFQEDAIVVLSLLRSGGIECEMLADGMLDSNPLFSTDVKGASVVVPDEQEADASALVADYKKRKGAKLA
jgi:hypothetical protein